MADKEQVAAQAPGAYVDEAEASTTFEPRRAKPEQEFGYTDTDGTQRVFRADADGVVHPSSVREVEVLDAFGLKTARTEAKDETPTREIAVGPKSKESK